MGAGYRTACTCGSVTDPDPAKAVERVAAVERSRYSVLSSTCVDDVRSILCAYGTPGLPGPWGRWFTTVWYSKICRGPRRL